MPWERHEGDVEDDGRVIADMSEVGRPSLFGAEAPRRRAGRERPDRERQGHEPEVELTSKERLWIILGALKAALSVSLVYVVFLAVVIGILLLVWS